MNRTLRRFALTLILAILSGISAEAVAGPLAALQKDNTGTGRSINIEGSVINAITGLGFKDDTIKVELLHPDSSLITYTFTRRYWNNYPSEMGISNRFIMQPEVTGERFIIRLSNPEFETVCYDVNVKGRSYDTGKLNIRRLSRYEKSRMLGEVTVTASVVAFVNKGDTIQYNADAFQVAQGSMLDAIIEQMPGVELRDDGRIYVNGRFVDKLLLDGKDFFKGNQLILLQNIPAYSVKDIKVYEKAGGITEVLGKGASDLSKPDQYVMDVTLKKGYNAGWLANAEAAGGTHSRYRGRAFGMGYTKTLRLSAYGQLNNVNETRKPGRSGEWSPADATNGLTSVKAGGMEVGVFRGNNEYTGNVSATYTDADRNVITARENFITGGNSHMRSWDFSRDKKTDLRMNHELTLRPAEGNRYNTHIEVNLMYNNTRTRNNSTQATFSSSPDISDALRDSIEAGMPGGLGILNRYLYELTSRRKYFNASWNQQSTFRFGNTNNGVTLSSDGFYTKSTTDGSDRNLLQYAGEPYRPQNRENPNDYHMYKYWVGARPQIRLSSVFNLQPLFAFCHWYQYKRDLWYTDADDFTGDPEARDMKPSTRRMLPSMMRDAIMRLDPQNSYTTGYHHTHQYGQLSFSYYKETQRDGRKYSSLWMQLYGGVNHMTRKLTFDGIDRQVVKRDYFEPEGTFYFAWETPGLAHRLSFRYNIDGTGLDPMNLVDVTFNSDPLNLRQGNPDLKLGIKQNFGVEYQGNKRIAGRLLLGASVEYGFTDRAVAMSYAYNRETGVRIHKPVNVDGGWNANTSLSTDVNLTSDGRFTLSNYLWLMWSHEVDMISYDEFATSQKTSINDLYVWNNFGLQYNIGRHMVGFDALIDTHHTTSDREGFATINAPSFNYGFRGRVVLPFDIELSTDIKMYQRRGHDDPSMNINTLLWNADLTKSFLDKRLIVGIEGYDILGNVKSIGYSINALGRTETWTASIPSYVMLSLRWNFTKKPRE